MENTSSILYHRCKSSVLLVPYYSSAVEHSNIDSDKIVHVLVSRSRLNALDEDPTVPTYCRDLH